MNKALETIMPATDIVGGRWVLVECHNKKELCRFYTDNGFEYIMDQPSEDERMVQMILKIKDVDS